MIDNERPLHFIGRSIIDDRSKMKRGEREGVRVGVCVYMCVRVREREREMPLGDFYPKSNLRSIFSEGKEIRHHRRHKILKMSENDFAEEKRFFGKEKK